MPSCPRRRSSLVCAALVAALALVSPPGCATSAAVGSGPSGAVLLPVAMAVDAATLPVQLWFLYLMGEAWSAHGTCR